MNRPRIIVNCAMSLDGKIASPTGKQLRISSDEDMKRVYELRHSVDAVLVGINTVLNDDPKLTVKEKYVSHPKQPIRIVLDAQCQTPVDALVVSDKARTIIVKDEKNACSKIFCDHVTVLSVSSVNGFLDLEKAMNILYDQGIRSILVEGGGTVILSFLKAGLVDELFVYIGSMIIGGKNTPTMAMGTGFDDEKTVIQLKLINTNHVGDGLLLHYQLKEA